jgi:hypothetical protein
MKTRILTFLTASLLAFSACKPEVGPIGPAYEAGAGIIGIWELSGADQTDLSLPVPETRNISDFYTNSSDKWVIQFNEDSTYSVNSAGPGFNVFGTSGTWRYNSPQYPSELHLTEDTVTTILPLGNMPRSIDQNVVFVYDRVRCDKPSVSYKLTFTRK